MTAFDSPSMKDFPLSLDANAPSFGALDKFFRNSFLTSSTDLASLAPRDIPLLPETELTSLPPKKGEGKVSLSNYNQQSSSSEQDEKNLQVAAAKSLALVEVRKQEFVDITQYLNMPQTDAAKQLNIPSSTLSKRWKEAVRKRKWPYRMVCKLDKEIMTLLHNVPKDQQNLPPEIESALGVLLKQRQEQLRPVIIRL